MVDPSSVELAEIAIATAETTRNVIGAEPRVALLSFSTKGSARHKWVDKIVEALRIVRERAPGLQIDGELQADAALVEAVVRSKAPGSPVAGRANTLIFPDVGIREHQRQAGGAASGRRFAWPVPARAGETGQRSVARLFGRRYLRLGHSDGAPIVECFRLSWSTIRVTI